MLDITGRGKSFLIIGIGPMIVRGIQYQMVNIEPRQQVNLFRGKC